MSSKTAELPVSIELAHFGINCYSGVFLFVYLLVCLGFCFVLFFILFFLNDDDPSWNSIWNMILDFLKKEISGFGLAQEMKKKNFFSIQKVAAILQTEFD